MPQNPHLATYLNDHLAGSLAAIELLDHLARAYARTPTEPFATTLRDDVAADQAELRRLMKTLAIGESTIRKVTAWVSEKFAQVKLRVDDPAGGAFRLMEASEALSLGIEGKASLWRALSALAESTAELRVLDYATLLTRAAEQRARVEKVRIEAASAALHAES